MPDKNALSVPRDSLALVRRTRADARRKQAALERAAHEEAKASRAHDAAKARLSTASVHLMRRLDRIEKHPSPHAVAELRKIGTDGKLPAEARTRAAAILLSWARLTSEPPAPPPASKRRRAKKGK